jgi:ABC-type spermidine/putrescine transport system permease subunit II
MEQKAPWPWSIFRNARLHSRWELAAAAGVLLLCLLLIIPIRLWDLIRGATEPSITILFVLMFASIALILAIGCIVSRFAAQ